MYCWSVCELVGFLTDLYGIQRDVSPVQAVPVIVKVQSHSLPEAGQRQDLVRACGQVIAVDGVPHSIQDKLVTLLKSTGHIGKDNLQSQSHGAVCFDIILSLCLSV